MSCGGRALSHPVCRLAYLPSHFFLGSVWLWISVVWSLLCVYPVHRSAHKRGGQEKKGVAGWGQKEQSSRTGWKKSNL